MFSLTVTEAAAELIRQQVRRSAIKRPAVWLLQVREGIPTQEELVQMQVSGDVRRTLKELVAKQPGIDQGRRKLLPCIYPRLRSLGLFLVEISGIVFFIPPSLRKKVSGGTLDIGQGGLVLFDRAGRIVIPAGNDPGSPEPILNR